MQQVSTEMLKTCFPVFEKYWQLLLLKWKWETYFWWILVVRKIKITWGLYWSFIKADIFWWGQLNPQLLAFISAQSCHWPLAENFIVMPWVRLSPLINHVLWQTFKSACLTVVINAFDRGAGALCSVPYVIWLNYC